MNRVVLNCLPNVWFPSIFMVLFRLSVLEHTFSCGRGPPSSLSVQAPPWRTLGWTLHWMNGSRTLQLGWTRPWMAKSLSVDHERRVRVSGRCSLRLPHCLVTLYWTALPWPVRPVLSILACEIGLLPQLHLEHNFDFTSYHVFFSMQALLSMLAVAWATILWPLRRTTSCFLPCWLPWCDLQRFHLHQSLSLPSGLKILTPWRLFHPQGSSKDVPVSKSTLVVMEFCGIHLYMNFQFLTWYLLHVKRLEQIEPTSPLPLLLSVGFLSKPSEVLQAANVCRATSCSICSPTYYRPCIPNQAFRSSSPWVDGCWGLWVW
jgi:hypothetical protein